MKDNCFWSVQSFNSKMKSILVEKYFVKWASILLAKGKIERIQYIDLFCGQGKYDDGTESTPVKITNIIAHEPKFAKHISLFFNDKDVDSVATLQSCISEDICARLSYRPVFSAEEVSIELIKRIDTRYPLFLFFDPYGYKGLSLELLSRLLSGYGSDAMIFFNYNRINPGTRNDSVEEHINNIFTKERADIIRSEFAKIDEVTPSKRMDIIIEHFQAALSDIGLKYTVLCKFYMGSKNKISHYVIGISKNERGYCSMKEIISKATDYKVVKDGFGTFEFNNINQVCDHLDIKDILKDELCDHFSKRTVTFMDLFQEHHFATNYYESNYKNALKALEDEDRITVDKYKDDGSKRTSGFPDGTVIKFK